MKRLSVLLVSILLLLAISTACGSDGLFGLPSTDTPKPTPEDTATPTPTETPVPTDTPIPTVTSTPQPTPTEFPISLLPGYYAFSVFEPFESGLSHSIGIARADWATYEIVSTHIGAIVMNLSWSSGGRYLAYEVYAHGPSGYYQLNFFDFSNNSEKSISLPANSSIDSSLSWAPDGSTLVFSIANSEMDGSELFTTNVQTRRLKNISNEPNASDEDPSWSPDGDFIAFSSNREGRYDIWTLSPQGTGLTNLTGGGDDIWDDHFPIWSPDGSRIAFFRFGEESNGLWIMSADGNNPRMLFELNNTDSSETPVWSPNGEWIAIVAGSGEKTEVWLVDPYYGEAIQVNREEGEYSGASWSPDSIALIYRRSLDLFTRRIHLAIVDVEWPFSMDMDTEISEIIWSPVDELP